MHDQWHDQLPFYVAGTLPAPERAALEHHLQTCPVCRAALAQWHDVATEVRVAAAARVLRAAPPALRLPTARQNGHHSLTTGGRLMTTVTPVFKPRTRRAIHPMALLAASLALLITLGVLLAALPGGSGDPSGGARFLTEPLPTASAAPSATPDPERVTLAEISRIRYELQGWNNHGPTTLSMALSYYGWTGGQEIIREVLRPNPEDKDVTPWEMVDYVNEHTGQRALTRVGGTMTLLRDLLAADFPVIIRTSIQPDGEDWMSHWVLLVGYDENNFLEFDSYLGHNNGNGRPMPYSVFDERWRHFARTFIVVYQPEQEMVLANLLGDYANPQYGYEVVLERARAAATEDRSDKWAWFNMGTAYTALGEYEDAVIAYDQAFELNLPFRILWYQYGPYEAYYETGDYAQVLALADVNLAMTSYVEETYFWQGMAHQGQGDDAAAEKSWQHIPMYNSNFDAQQAYVP